MASVAPKGSATNQAAHPIHSHGDQALNVRSPIGRRVDLQGNEQGGRCARQGQVGTSRVLTDGDGNVAARVVYTAFGEPVFSEPPAQAGGLTRYLYAGAWGYETGLLSNDPASNAPPFAFLHVGERWYDPATGRFLQRDPIGIPGALNVYAYTGSLPTFRVDPYGLWTLSFGIQGQLQVGPFAFSFFVAVNVGSGGVNISATAGGGTGLGLSAGVGFTVAWTNASSVSSLAGCAAVAGLNSPGISGGYISGGHDWDLWDGGYWHEQYQGFELSVGKTFGGGVYVEGNGTKTWPY